MNKMLIKLTHVCRGWRGALISCPSLWTRLHFKSIDKTLTFLQRSRSSPLAFYLYHCKFLDGAFALALPHIPRLKSLTIKSWSLKKLLRHFNCHMPLLEKLDINLSTNNRPDIDAEFPSLGISSLRELRLKGVTTNLLWKHLENLQAFTFTSHQTYQTTQILDFLESAPLLHTVSLEYSLPGSSDAPPERTVHLRHLKYFAISANPPHSILLHHLHIPFGASLTSDFGTHAEESPLLDYLPDICPNFDNLSHITTIYLTMRSCVGKRLIRLSGPSGRLAVSARYSNVSNPRSFFPALNRRTLRSLDPRIHPTAQKLLVSGCENILTATIETCPIFLMLSSMDQVRALVLRECDNEPFIRALDPKRNPSNLLLCPRLNNLMFYVDDRRTFEVEPSIADTVKNRDSRGAKLSSVMFLNMGTYSFRIQDGVRQLRKHVGRAEYMRPDELESVCRLAGLTVSASSFRKSIGFS